MIIREVQPKVEPPIAQQWIVGYHTVRCSHCPKTWRNRKPEDCTSSLFVRHIRDCHRHLPWKEEMAKEMLATQIASSHRKRQRTETTDSTTVTPWTVARNVPPQAFGQPIFTEEHFRRLLVKFLVCTNSSFYLVENEAFRELLKYCNRNVPLFSRFTANVDLLHLYDEMFPVIQSLLIKHKDAGGRIHLTLDAWTAGNKLPYLGITGHWYDEDFVLHDLVLDLVPLRGSHTADNLANAVEEMLIRYVLPTSVVGCITMDNASVNTALCGILEQRFINWKKQDGHVRCMAHVINLAVQKILKTFRAEALEAETDMAEAEVWQPAAELSPGAILKKVRRVVCKLRASTLKWEGLQRECAALDPPLKCLRPILDMRIRFVHCSNFTLSG
jgi:hypothetical protein